LEAAAEPRDEESAAVSTAASATAMRACEPWTEPKKQTTALVRIAQPAFGYATMPSICLSKPGRCPASDSSKTVSKLLISECAFSMARFSSRGRIGLEQFLTKF